MLLAEALVERADAQTRLSELERRISENARVQEGDAPSEDPDVLLEEAAEVISRLRRLIVAINATNATTTMPDGMTVTEALARRDELATRIRLLLQAGKAAAAHVPRFGRAEIRDVAMLDVKALREEADRLREERRALDVELQRVNWSAELATGV